MTNKTLPMNKIFIFLLFIGGLSISCFGAKNKPDSATVILYDIFYKYQYTHTTTSDFMQFIDDRKSLEKYSKSFCVFTIVNDEQLEKLNVLVANLKRLRKIEEKEFLGKYVHLGVRLYYGDSTSFIAIEPKRFKSIYSNNYEFKKSPKLIGYLMTEIRTRYQNKECILCSD